MVLAPLINSVRKVFSVLLYVKTNTITIILWSYRTYTISTDKFVYIQIYQFPIIKVIVFNKLANNINFHTLPINCDI